MMKTASDSLVTTSARGARMRGESWLQAVGANRRVRPCRNTVVCISTRANTTVRPYGHESRWLGSALLAAAAIIAAGVAYAGEGTPLEQITARLNAALECDTLTQANSLLAEAEAILDRNKLSLSRAARAFLQAEISRVRGAVTMNLLTDDPASVQEARRSAIGSFQEALALYQAVQEQQPASIDADRFGIAAERSIAWAEYGLACALDGGPTRAAHLESALRIFRTFTAGGGRDAAMLDCLLGHARCLRELGRNRELIALLEPAIWGGVPPAYAREFARIFVHACRQQRNSLKLHLVAQRHFENPPPGRSLDAVDRELAREWARSLAVLLSGCPPSYRPALKEAAEKALGLMSMIGESCPELEKAASADGEGSTTVHLARARRSFIKGTWADALAHAEAGVKAATKATPTAVLADLRYIRFAALWNLQKLADSFRAAADFLSSHPADGRWVEVCDRAIDAAFDAEPAVPLAVVRRLLEPVGKRLARGPELPWYRGALLLAAKEHSQAEAALGEILPASPLYRRACYGLARAAWEQKQPARAAEALARLPGVPGKPADAELSCIDRSAALAVAVADALLQSDPPDAAAARDLLAKTAALPAGERAGSAQSVVKRAVLRVRADLALGETSRLTGHLADLGASNDDKLRAWALAELARDLEAAYQRLTSAGEAEAVNGLHAPITIVYSSLLAMALAERNKPQALAARRHIALNLLRAGKHKEAMDAYEQLEKDLAPEQPGDVLRGLAVCSEKTGSPEEAIRYWQALCNGLPQQTDEWFEARCSLIECYRTGGQIDHARKMLEYFKLQCPNPPQKWQARIEELERTMKDER